MDALAREILAFWFGSVPHAAREVWFRKDDAFDARIRARFGDAVDAAIDGAYEDWSATPHGTLACILLLDQFTRNIHRGTPRAFAGDGRALGLAGRAVDAGFDHALDTFERWFCYLPFEHAETLAAQERSLVLFRSLADHTGLHDPYVWAERHAAIVRRFGRFPHRNAILGRASTPEEIAFLREPGSSF